MSASHSRSKINVSALAILSALLFASILSVTPRLHERIHNTPLNHECAVTLIASGKYELQNAPALAPTPQSFVEFSPLTARSLDSVPALFLSASVFERAPPALS
jgi:hypothetical protein